MQLVQVAELIAATAEENVPGEQPVQFAGLIAPTAEKYWPAEQSRQLLAAVEEE